MKRECLLSRASTLPPMTFRGQEIHFSALVNELLRELETPFFHGPTDHRTDTSGVCECIALMDAMARNDFERINWFRAASHAERSRFCTTFYLENEEEIERLKPELTARLECAMAAVVEREGEGKPQPPRPGCSPRLSTTPTATDSTQTISSAGGISPPSSNFSTPMPCAAAPASSGPTGPSRSPD